MLIFLIKRITPNWRAYINYNWNKIKRAIALGINNKNIFHTLSYYLLLILMLCDDMVCPRTIKTIRWNHQLILNCLLIHSSYYRVIIQKSCNLTMKTFPRKQVSFFSYHKTTIQVGRHWLQCQNRMSDQREMKTCSFQFWVATTCLKRCAATPKCTAVYTKQNCVVRFHFNVVKMQKKIQAYPVWFFKNILYLFNP